nr:GRAM domain-containing protein 2B-like [Pelodiscus sinensis]|eukprot:XP_014424906.1 GRAM domain-containing protein 2B-like [Pelodiscus sinensis]
MEPPCSEADSALGGAGELCLADPAASSGKLKRSKKKMLEQKWQSLEETGSNAPQQRKHPSLIRSKTYDPSFSKEPEPEQAPGMQRAAPSCVSCAWQREVPYHGRLYVSQNYVCFQCSMLRRDIKVVIPVSSITVLKKANMALVVPNALSIRTSEGEKFLFVSLRTREATYQLLRSVCKHLQDGSVSSSPLASPANTSLW